MEMGVPGSRCPHVNSVPIGKEQSAESAAAGRTHAEVLGPFLPCGDLLFSSLQLRVEDILQSVLPVSRCHPEAVGDDALCPASTPPPFKCQSKGQIELFMTAPD